jgi:hypothetical protein
MMIRILTIPCGDIILLHDIGKESWMSVSERLLEHRAAADSEDLEKSMQSITGPNLRGHSNNT